MMPTAFFFASIEEDSHEIEKVGWLRKICVRLVLEWPNFLVTTITIGNYRSHCDELN